MHDRAAVLDAFQERLGHRFAEPELLDQALTHASWAHEHGGESNERLEFLGDAFLDAVVTRLLFRTFPHLPEGLLSQQKHRLVATAPLARIGRDLGLDRILKVGTGARRNDVARNPNKVEDTTEALAAALVLDAGFEPAAAIIEGWFEPLVDELELQRLPGDPGYKNAISLLHERLARKPLRLKAHALELGRRGSAHQPIWEMGWWAGGRLLARTWGPSKKIAQREAARLALEALDALLQDGWSPDREAEPPEAALEAQP